MKICLKKIVRMSLVVLEARFGHSTLQTYDAILRTSFMARGTEPKIRIPIFIIFCLPIGLSAGYKQFIGGEVTKKIYPDISTSDRAYGFFPPTSTEAALFTSFGNTPYLLTNATFDFCEQSATDDTFPKASIADGKTIPYGYNLLLLSNNSAAALDLPRSSYLKAIKDKLNVGESWIINAEVYGLVTQLNETVEDLRNKDGFWDYVINLNTPGFKGMTSFSHFANETSLGMVPYIPNNDNTMSCLLGMYYPSRTFWSAYYTDTKDAEILAFRNSTFMFTTHRAKCRGSWRVTRDTLQLLEGDCPAINDNIVESAIFSQAHSDQFSPYPLDVLPILVHSLQDFADVRAGSPWKVPSYTMAVVASYWARGAYMDVIYENEGVTDIIQDTIYPPTPSESIHSTRSALRPDPWLYFILAVQPFLTVVALLLNILLHSTPISKDFGLISILSGINPENLPLLRGAGLSGCLNQPAKLGISVADERIQYTLSITEKEKEKSFLQMKTIYN